LRARCLDAPTFAVFDVEAGDLAILDDIDAARIGAARIAPGHRIMPHRAATPLKKPALDRKAGIVEIEKRQLGAQLIGIGQFRIRSGQEHRVGPPHEGIALRVGMKQVQD